VVEQAGSELLQFAWAAATIEGFDIQTAGVVAPKLAPILRLHCSSDGPLLCFRNFRHDCGSCPRAASSPDRFRSSLRARTILGGRSECLRMRPHTAPGF